MVLESFVTNGALIGVLIDPFDRLIELYRRGGSVTKPAYDRVVLGPELPGFVIDLHALD